MMRLIDAFFKINIDLNRRKVGKLLVPENFHRNRSQN